MGWGYPLDVNDLIARAKKRGQPFARVLKHVESLKREDEKLSAFAWEVGRGWFPTLQDRKTLHSGIDIGLPDGGGDTYVGAPVLAIGDGTVVHADSVVDWSPQKYDFGRVIVKHPTPNGDAYALYMQLGSIDTWPNAEVRQGDRLGTVGWHGDFHHLHFAVASQSRLGDFDAKAEVNEGKWPKKEGLWNVLRVMVKELDPNEWIGMFGSPWYLIQPIEFVRAMKGDKYKHYTGAGSPHKFTPAPAVASSAARHDEDNVHTAAAVLKYDPFKNNAKLVKLATGDGDPLRSGVCDDAVDALQKALDFCHSLSLPDGEAGTFGPATEDGLKQFQERMKTEIGQLAESFGKSAGDVKPGELDRFTLLLLDACAVGHHEADAGNTDGDGAGAAAAPSETERPPAAADTGPQPQWVFDARPGKRKTSIQFGLRLYEALLEWELQYENGIVKPDAEGRGCLYSANHDKSYKPYEDVYNKFFEALPLEQRWKPGTQSPMYAEWPRIDLSHPEIEEGGSGIPKFVDLNGKKYKLYDAAANWVANGRTNCCNSQFAAFFVAAGGKKIQVKKTDGPPVSYSLRNKGNADPYIGKNDKDKDIRPIMAFQAAVMCNGANKDNDGNLIHDHFLRGGGTSAMLCLGLGEPVAENGKYTINQDSLVQVRLGDWANWFSHSWLVADVEYGIWTKDDAKQPDIKVAQSSFVKGSGGAAVPLDKTMLRDLAKDEAGFETRLGAFLKGCREDKKYKGKDVKRFEVVRFCVLSANGTNNVVHGDFYVPKCSKCDSFPDDRGKCKCKCPTCAEPADDKGKCKCDKKKGKPGVLADDSPLVKHEEKTAHPANQKLRGISRNWVNVPSGKPIEEERTEKDEKGKKKQVKTGRTAGPGGSFCRWFGPFSE